MDIYRWAPDSADVAAGDVALLRFVPGELRWLIASLSAYMQKLGQQGYSASTRNILSLCSEVSHIANELLNDRDRTFRGRSLAFHGQGLQELLGAVVNITPTAPAEHTIASKIEYEAMVRMGALGSCEVVELTFPTETEQDHAGTY